jgi:2-oxoglutarate/2-oxoacid ferredoxin oxidoreductase subunit alpha
MEEKVVNPGKPDLGAPSLPLAPAHALRMTGDAHDGIVMLSHLFALAAGSRGYHLYSVPEYPAEIRSHANTLAGVYTSSLAFAPYHEPIDDRTSFLLAMNPAGLKLHESSLEKDGILLANSDSFGPDELACAGYLFHRTISVPMAQLTNHAINLARAGEKGALLSYREVDRCRNLFALGMLLWYYSIPIDPVLRWLKQKFSINPSILDASQKAFKAGFIYSETANVFPQVPAYHPVESLSKKGRICRMISGNDASLLALKHVALKTNRPVLLASTSRPPSHEISSLAAKNTGDGFSFILADDEHAAASIAIGVSYGGGLGCTAVSGIGFPHQSEVVSLASAAELPLLLLEYQRAGISTGLPQRVAQSDLGMALMGRNGEAPLVVLAPDSPSDCFALTLLAAKVAMRFLAPVCILHDLLNSRASESWLIPEPESLPDFEFPHFASDSSSGPYECDDHLARPWITPGTPGKEHRLGGNERKLNSPQVSFLPLDHLAMNRHRAARMQRIAEFLGPLPVSGDNDAQILLLGWGGTKNVLEAATALARKNGISVAFAHLRFLNPLPKNMQMVLNSYPKVIVAELNSGRLFALLKEKFEFNGISFTRQDGLNFVISQVEQAIVQFARGESS